MNREPRLFVAVPLDEVARTAVTGIVEGVRAQIPDGRGIRWVRLDGLHLTLRFIGPTDAGRVPIVAEALHEAAIGQAATGCGWPAPAPSRPTAGHERSGWASPRASTDSTRSRPAWTTRSLLAAGTRRPGPSGPT